MDSERALNVLAICGSLRAGSLNKGVLRAVCEVAPPELQIDVRYLHDIPLYNYDVESLVRPASVAAFCAAIAAADGIAIATPEYLYSISGVLKNALDWTSGKPSVFAGKPVMIVSAGSNAMGGVRAQYELRKVMQALHALVMPAPEVFIGPGREKFAGGELVDPAIRDALQAQALAFRDWIRRLAPAQAAVH